ncbi:hypothetical protein TSUD_264130 [Trifolium subterraneum]|uniref:Aminotransferase-like plant mobile domain-containing protein n=1 Tax=Trifolium subterraneum TaxID=3900 RepID=A0A2Z6P705_TRISU|nr:hypothetical protein TSUD_264130 [Trifolium subterraneum]
MTDEVGRQRGGRKSRAHSSARREATLGPSKRKVNVASTSGAQLQEPEAEHPEPQPMAEEEGQDDVEAQEDDDREDGEDQNDEVDPPSAPKQTKRNRRTTSSKNPPKPKEPQVTEFGGGPSDLSLLPSFGGHVAAALWRGEEEFDKMKGAHVSFAKLLEIYHDNLNLALAAEDNEDEEEETVEFLRDCTVRAFLLYLIGGTLFTNKSAQYMDLIFLSYLQDIPLINTWNWGASGLAYMYNYLDRASRRRCGNHGGYNCMFQAWVFAHFKRYGQRFLDENYTNEEPVGAKYYPLKTGKWPYETRTSLDRMEVDEVTFCPYEDHRQFRPFQDISWYSG